MTQVDHSAYYDRRAAEARAIAARCTDKGVRKIHLDMAARYAAMIDTPPPTSAGGSHFDLL